MNEPLHTIFSDSECPSHSRLMDYARGNLPEDEMHLMEQHLVDCEMCSDELEGLSKMKSPADLDRIVAGIEEQVSRRRARILGLHRNTFLMAAAALLILLIGSVFMIRLLTLNKPGNMVSEAVKTVSPSVIRDESTSPEPVVPVQKQDKLTRPASKGPVAEAREESLAVAGVADTESDQDFVIMTELEIPPEPAPVAAIVASRDTLPSAGAGITAPVATESQMIEAADYKIRSAAKESKKTEQPALMNMAMNAFTSSDYGKAASLFEKVLKDEPDNSRASYCLAYSWFRLDKPDKAAQALIPVLADTGNLYYQKAVQLSDSLK